MPAWARAVLLMLRLMRRIAATDVLRRLLRRPPCWRPEAEWLLLPGWVGLLPLRWLPVTLLGWLRVLLPALPRLNRVHLRGRLLRSLLVADPSRHAAVDLRLHSLIIGRCSGGRRRGADHMRGLVTLLLRLKPRLEVLPAGLATLTWAPLLARAH